MKHLFLVLFGSFFLLPHFLDAQWETPTLEDTIRVYEGLFDDDLPMHLTLKSDLKNFRKTRRDENYQPAELTFHVNDTLHVTHPVRIRARGIYRRDNCYTPPFWLNIRNSGIEADDLQSVRKIKVVTRCRESRSFEDYVLREYLVYKIYNLVSPYSLRTRLIRLEYVDTGRENKKRVDWAFLIEPEELLAERLQASITDSDRLSMRTVNSRAMDLLAMFHYMIGNGDYSVTGRHNLVILALDTAGPDRFIPVPYDFDYTGLVNTHYAVPGESLGISSVRERYFLGPCRSERMHLDALNHLVSLKSEIIDMIMQFEYLDEEERLAMAGYIEAFFIEAEDEQFIERNITSTCQ